MIPDGRSDLLCSKKESQHSAVVAKKEVATAMQIRTLGFFDNWKAPNMLARRKSGRHGEMYYGM